ncbi:MAG TPA: SIR2 family protein [Gemmatimonadales bacterium]|nr:SIR2 family protein [Gemmatimonadales bacterium]
MNQAEFTGLFSVSPQNFAWFLGAGASRAAGLPTATDVLWDMKRRYYCQQENQEITRHDVHNPAVRERIQAYFDSRNFPSQGALNEYSAYFEKIFGEDKERQRRYLKAILSEEQVTLSVGNRVLGALLSSGLTRAAFTTNFDTVVERAVAEVSGKSLSAYHLEGSSTAVQALNNEEFPLYCKLHGDFRYDSIKNLSADLATQNDALSKCLVNAGNRFGFVVAGYSGRDSSVMDLFREVLNSHNPFPHGFFWLTLKGSTVLPVVTELLEIANQHDVRATLIEIETFDALMLRVWRNIESKFGGLDARVRKAQALTVNIPLPPAGTAKPVIRLNALPVVERPSQSLALSFQQGLTFTDVRRIRDGVKADLILGNSQSILCWGSEQKIRQTFGGKLAALKPENLPARMSTPETLHLKGFLEEALGRALTRGKPLSTRSLREGVSLIAKPSAPRPELLDPLRSVTGEIAGEVPGLVTTPSNPREKPEKVRWAESIRVSLDEKDGRTWLVLEPDIWIWPKYSRRAAAPFLDSRRADRFNNKQNALLSAWIRIILGTDDLNKEVTMCAFDDQAGPSNPAFRIVTRSAFSRRRD